MKGDRAIYTPLDKSILLSSTDGSAGLRRISTSACCYLIWIALSVTIRPLASLLPSLLRSSNLCCRSRSSKRLRLSWEKEDVDKSAPIFARLPSSMDKAVAAAVASAVLRVEYTRPDMRASHAAAIEPIMMMVC